MVRGEGEHIVDEHGARWLDLYGGHCVCATGHSHPHVVDALSRQAKNLLFYSAAGDLEIRQRAAAALVDFSANAFGDQPGSVFFCNSGAEANENALKIALKRTGRRRLAAVQGGWHGRSLLCLSVTDDDAITQPYRDHLLDCERLPLNNIAALDTVDWTGIAAMIVEPVQSMSGIRVADRNWLAALREQTARHGVVLIFDEIQTGMGRLGAPWAANAMAIRPDIITSAKGLASGVPMGAVLMSQLIAADIAPGDLGSTFAGGPLACAAMLATLEVIAGEELMDRAGRMQGQLTEGLRGTVVTDLRGQGLLLGMDCGEHAQSLKRALFDDRILVGGSSDPSILRLMPPLTLSDLGAEQLISAVMRYSESC